MEMSPTHFLTGSLPLFTWSVEHDCRFFVRIYDLTQAHEKGIYKHHLRTVGERFYYYEVLDATF